MNIYHVRQQLRMKSIYDMNLRFVYYARFRLKQIQKELDKYKGISPEDIDGTIVQELIDHIFVYPIEEWKAKLEIILNTGEKKDGFLGCSGNMFKTLEKREKSSKIEGSPLSCSGNTLFNIYPEQHISKKPSIYAGSEVALGLLNIIPEQHMKFYRQLRSFSGHKMPVEYISSIAI